ncbi:hypothetical protein ACH5RR_016080, partial [Cinchona calisaya]
MFYSQFILAKKGPLGTIWIAAHLERKLRKNQVADTDIGVSVDSILFPDVPIALRLSSHLLLGVVRIYSRKVNYLFDDCSEALLKVKQAFRSTAVDLPPEESKAPYHSITVPETFDLDDFELPDNDMFQGNYVDHHISSREQITLQDNMEGVVYSTSKFGLDERFGDGDTSGLDLDEELFMSKIDAAGHSGVSDDPQASFRSLTPLKEEEHEGMPANPETEIEIASGDVDLMDYAQAPCTPGLIEEPNLSNVQETSACDDHVESEDNHLMESAVKENLENTSSRLNLHLGNEHMVDWSMPDERKSAAALCMPCEENGYHSSDMGIKKGLSSATEVNIEHILSNEHDVVSGQDKIGAASASLDREEELQYGIVKTDGTDAPSVDMSYGDTREIIGVVSEGGAKDASGLVSPSLQGAEDDGENFNNVGHAGRPSSPRDALQFGADLQDTLGLGEPESCPSEEPKNSHTSNLENEIPIGQDHIFRPCTSDLVEPDSSHAGAEHPDDFEPSDVAAFQLETSNKVEILQASGASTMEQGEVCNSVNSEQNVKDNCTTEPASLEDIRAGSGKLDDRGNNVHQGDNNNSSADIDFPAPEKMLSVPEEFGDQPRNLLMEATAGDLAGVDESDAGSRIVSGRKRSYTESTLTEQSLYSVESSRAVRAKKTVEAVPDDDDLLSSILVGRRSSVLKVKPSPPPPYVITSLKRHRSAPRTTTSKRKMLMDDTMVLHGDTIRQQLMNTEDIRRLRKKAPCTRPEIAMIQKQFLEDEIFGESIFSGVSIYLASLHNEPYDLSRIMVTQDEVDECSLMSAAIDLKLTSATNDENADKMGIEIAVDSSGQKVVETDVDGGDELANARENGEIKPAQTCELNDNKLDEQCSPSMDADTTKMQMKPTEDLVVADHISSPLQHLQNVVEIEIDGGSSSIAGAVKPAFPVEIKPSDRVSGDIGDTSADTVHTASIDKRGEMDALVQMDELLVSSNEKRESECGKVNISMIDGVDEKVNDDNDDTVKVGDIVASVETEPSARDGISVDAIQSGVETARDTNNLGMDYYAIEIENMDDRRLENNDQVCDDTFREQPIISSSRAVEDVTLQAFSLHEGEYPMQHESYVANIVDPENSGLHMHDHDDLNYSAAANDT